MIDLRTSRRCLSAAFLIACLLAAVPARATAEQRYPVFGLVLEIKGPHTFVVSCKEIPGFMEAMAMPFEVKDPGELKPIHVGMLVDFTLVVGEDSSYAAKIKVHAFQSPDQRPSEVRRLNLLDGAFTAKPASAEMLAVNQKVPEFALIDQHRRPVKFSDFSGKVVAVSFAYTRCAFPEYCFRLSNNLGQVAKRFTGRLDSDLVLLTITFDPSNDSPEALDKYAHTWKSSAKGWYFLTGSTAEVKRVCLLFGMNFWPDRGMLVHSMHTAVIDRQGHLVTNLEGNEFSAEQLGNLIATVMDRKP